MQHKCEICDKDFDSLWGISSHNVKKHYIKTKETFIKYNLEGMKLKMFGVWIMVTHYFDFWNQILTIEPNGL